MFISCLFYCSTSGGGGGGDRISDTSVGIENMYTICEEDHRSSLYEILQGDAVCLSTINRPETSQQFRFKKSLPPPLIFNLKYDPCPLAPCPSSGYIFLPPFSGSGVLGVGVSDGETPSSKEDGYERILHS